MNAPAARVACPVLTCTKDMSADAGIMCTACWIGLPAYQRVAVESATKAVRRQPHARNRDALHRAIAVARQAAQKVSP